VTAAPVLVGGGLLAGLLGHLLDTLAEQGGVHIAQGGQLDVVAGQVEQALEVGVGAAAQADQGDADTAVGLPGGRGSSAVTGALYRPSAERVPGGGGVGGPAGTKRVLPSPPPWKAASEVLGRGSGSGGSPGGDVIRVRADITQEDRVDGLPLGTRGGALIRYTFP
jgi:hypothetical protein